jgi:hypothetical protein
VDGRQSGAIGIGDVNDAAHNLRNVAFFHGTRVEPWKGIASASHGKFATPKGKLFRWLADYFAAGTGGIFTPYNLHPEMSPAQAYSRHRHAIRFIRQ